MDDINDISRAINELEQKKEQLDALILFLKKAGSQNPQYYQIENCETEYELANFQIDQLKKIQQARKKLDRKP